MNNLPKLFISIDELEISLIVGHNDDQNSFKLLEKSIFSIEGISKNKITDLDKIINLTNNFEISFLNLCGFKNLNGTQISKENITYILNLLKSCVDEFEENKKILHIFNSEYCLDKKKLDNLPIGLFGDFYSHELSFNLISKNDYKNLENIFKKCNLKIKKILLESFVKGSLINDANPKIETYFYIQINDNNSKIFYVENNAFKFEQKFNFGYIKI
jgi:cell division ATPase FtsA